MRNQLSIDKEVINHDFVEGKWWVDGTHLVRNDRCLKCGCIRSLVRSNTKQGTREQSIAFYERSSVLFEPTKMPSCWGAINPK